MTTTRRPRRQSGSSPPQPRSRPKANPKANPRTTQEIDRLAELGLARGDRVRFRRRTNERWHDGVLTGLERDGSLGLSDGKGASRAIAAEQVEVRTSGPRGGVAWVPVPVWAARTEQLRLI